MWQYDYSYLQHGINGFKYIDKFLSKAGNWVYVYKDKAQKALKKAPQNVTSKLNTLKNKAEEIYTKVTKNNKYSTNSFNYDKKVSQIKNTKEWQDIVNKKDPEYTKKNKDGSYSYDIDSYIVKKKHPVLNIIDDLINGRDLSVHDISAESIIAGAEDYLQAGLAYIGVRAKVLETAFKYRQGSYQDEQMDVENTIQNGIKFLNKVSKAYEENEDSINDILDTYSKTEAADIAKIKRYATTISNYAKNNDVDVNDILESKKIQEYLKENGISEEQIKKYI